MSVHTVHKQSDAVVVRAQQLSRRGSGALYVAIPRSICNALAIEKGTELIVSQEGAYMEVSVFDRATVDASKLTRGGGRSV